MDTTARAALFALLALALLPACSSSGGGGGFVPPCQNGFQDPAESGVDCGGACGACPGATCGAPGECASAICAGGTCAEASCDDGVRNGSEVGVDCGGKDCPTCAFGACANGVQDAGEEGVDCGGACTPCGQDPTCDDGVKNQGEAAVDCGGPCVPCQTTDPCANGVQDAGEEGVDCGGTCTPCGQDPTCDDGVKNQGEAAVDCGGPCGPCPIGSPCGAGSDCATGVCDGGTCGEAGASCTNNEKDPGESDVDCGGDACPACAVTKFCSDHGDCLSETCVFGVCEKPTCDDGLENQDETDVDCGGDKCGPCEDGEACQGPGDCASGACDGGVCVSCEDEVENGEETGVDCGGPVCVPCGLGSDCAGHADCTTGTCLDGTCVEEGTASGACEIEQDCADGFYCGLQTDEEAGPAAGWDGQCLAEGDGAAVGESCGEGCAGMGCWNGYCTATCDADAQCPSGLCAASEGLFDTDGDQQADVALPYGYCLAFTDPGGECLSHAECSVGERCTIYMDQNPTAGGSLDPDGPYVARGRCEDPISGAGYGQPCEDGAGCASGYCGNQGLCTEYCTSHTECSSDFQVGQQVSAVCSYTVPWAGGDLSDPTNYVGISRCVAIPESSKEPCGPGTLQAYTCEDPAERCLVWTIGFGPDVPAEVEHLCSAVPVESKQLGEPCYPGAQPSECDSGYCLRDDQGEGFCSALCTPSGAACDDSAGEPLTCQETPLIERAGKYAPNGVSQHFCRP